MKIFATALLLLACGATYASPKLYVFDCGLLTVDDVAEFGLKPDETPVRVLNVPCYLIEHEKGKLLWDTGLPLGVVGKGSVRIDDGTLRYERSIVDQLAAMNIAPRDLTVAFSHMHFDHAGGANAFADSKVLMQRAEWDAVLADYPQFEPKVYDKLENNPNVTIIHGDYDVFGDGSVRIVYSPGHTPGHQSLLVNLQNTGPVVLSGDLYHFRESRTLRRVPTFNYDKAQSLQSIDKVEALVKETHATLWIEHDKALADTLKKAPQFYD